MGVSDHLTCLLTNLYVCQEAAVRTGHETTDWFQIRKGVHQGILSPCLFNLHAQYIMRNVAGIKIAGRNINNLICRWCHPYGWKQRRTKEPLDESEKGEWKIGLKLNIQTTKIMASSCIASWQKDGKQWKQWETLILGASKSLRMVTAAMKLKDTFSFEEKLWLT